MKIVRRRSAPRRGRVRAARDPRPCDASPPRASSSQGTIATHDVWPAYVERVLSFVDLEAIRPLTVVIDAANGMAGVMLPPVLERLPIDARTSFFEPDGTFPNHEPNPLLPENREFIVAKTLEEGADLGVAFDGDADRCFFVDDTGDFVPGDFVTALLAESILESDPERRSSTTSARAGRSPTRSSAPAACRSINRVGHAYIKHRMREESAVFGGEVSGHYYFRDFSQADSGVMPFLLMLELISKRGQKLSELLAPFRDALLPHRRAQHAGRRRRCEAAGVGGPLRPGGPDLPSGRRLGRGGRLALQRAAVEHRAAAAAQPRSAIAAADGAQARRGARGDPGVTFELGFTTDEKPPFKYSARHAGRLLRHRRAGDRLLRPLRARTSTSRASSTTGTSGCRATRSRATSS